MERNHCHVGQYPACHHQNPYEELVRPVHRQVVHGAGIDVALNH